MAGSLAPLTLRDKTAIVTGASSGLGLVTARELARRGARVALVCRNPDKAEQARAYIEQVIGPEAKLDILLCDLSLIANVRALADDIKSRYDKVDILVNNAGIMPGQFTLTSEGHELSWATNHLAPFALTNLLLPLMLEAKQARIITVASDTYRLGQIEFSQEARNAPDKYSSLTAYCDSKLANILFTNELSHRLELTGITANCLHPGMVNTGLINPNSSLLMKALWWIAKPFMISPERGARTSIYLAASPDVASISGKYFKGSKVTTPSAAAQNRLDATRLWRISEEETGISA
ncbi:SDR family oxidoreductase [Hymenobacter jejuensis]|uniref:SDR family oxidoreductase n=1 Tax=Hymenobacter jejuensis TaxID=2502781 RepID=A0A5B8A561_9BACT|nr:SDR family oxidoreductase [Hymenobacter jejuensis]QDA61783.1 SDR family oxidoreductase [Hymenobacter jejuensis]